MEAAALELTEGLEEDGNECMDVFCSIQRVRNLLSIVGVRITDTNPRQQSGSADRKKVASLRLIKEEDVCFIVPSIGVPNCAIR